MQRTIRYAKRRLEPLFNLLSSSTQASSPWDTIMANSQQVLTEIQRPANGKRILSATSVGSHTLVTAIDSLVAMGLHLRGGDVQFLLCDGALPACEAAMLANFDRPDDFVTRGPAHMCSTCFSAGSTLYRPLPIPLHRYHEYVTQDEVVQALKTAVPLSIEECYSYTLNGMQLGEQARAGVLRFFGKATFEEEDPVFVQAIARRYLAGALVAAQVAERAIDAVRPDCIVAHHGVYVPQGVLGIVARRKGVHVVNWGTSYRNTTVIYSHDDTYHHTFMHEPVANWENRVLSPAEADHLDQYLALRRNGKGDWSWVAPDRGNPALAAERDELLKSLGLSPTLPTFGLLTNVLWDAQLYYGNLAFPDMLDWLFVTLEFFIAHPELQLIVRIHPHEVKAGNRQPTGPEIAKRYPSLPPNIKVVDRDSPHNTYALMNLCQAALIYGTKTGVELTPLGQPVIVTGDAWIRNKGISYDVSSKDEYLQLLEQLPRIEPLSPAVIERARRYAYHYFFRRMIPLKSLDPSGGWPPQYVFNSLADLLPGCDPGLDVICNGILTGQEFIYEPL